MADRHPTSRRNAGFTVTELIVVVAIIALIVGLIIPTTAKVRAKSRTLRCLANQRQLTQANYSYATSNGGRWTSPRTDSGGTLWRDGANDYGPGGSQSNPKATPHCWVAAQFPNVAGSYEKPAALEQGTLWPYIGTIQAYISPDEPTNTLGQVNSNEFTRIRSYSFNACLGVTRPDEVTNYDGAFINPLAGDIENAGMTMPLSAYNTTTIATVKQPARMMSTLVEDDNIAWNNEGWIINPQPAQRLWVDLPAQWRPDAITLSYVDGSTDSHEMANPDTVAVNNGAPYPANFTVYGPGPHNVRAPDDAAQSDSDWKWFRDRLNPGVLPQITNMPMYSE